MFNMHKISTDIMVLIKISWKVLWCAFFEHPLKVSVWNYYHFISFFGECVTYVGEGCICVTKISSAVSSAKYEVSCLFLYNFQFWKKKKSLGTARCDYMPIHQLLFFIIKNISSETNLFSTAVFLFPFACSCTFCRQH